MLACRPLVWWLLLVAEHEGLADASAWTVEFDEASVVDDAVDDGGGEFVVGEDGAPFAEFDVGGEDDATTFVGAGDDLVEQARSVDVEGHVAEFVEDDQVGAGQVLEDLVEVAGAFGVAQLQDEFGGVYVQCFLSSLGGIFPQLGLLAFRSVGSVWAGGLSEEGIGPPDLYIPEL